MTQKCSSWLLVSSANYFHLAFTVFIYEVQSKSLLLWSEYLCPFHEWNQYSYKRGLRDLASSTMWGFNEKGLSMRKQALITSGALNLVFPVSRTVRSKFLLFISYLIYDVLLLHLEWTKAIVFMQYICKIVQNNKSSRMSPFPSLHLPLAMHTFLVFPKLSDLW
jgi:hypothetical protein